VVVELPQGMAQLVRAEPMAEVLTGDGPVTPEKITVFPVADPRANTFTVRLELPDGQFGFYPGMFVKVAFLVSESERLLVPASSIVRRSELTAVYVVSGETARLRQVRLGQHFGDRVEVLSGIGPGEMIAHDPVAAGIWLKGKREN
jgi:multidrug efflux pump subunit AcrA (membrane-fusion protein)